MSSRQGYVMKFPDGRVVSSDGAHNDEGKWFKKMRQAYGAQITFGPRVKRPRRNPAKATS